MMRMKNAVLFLLAIALTAGPASAGPVRLALKASYFSSGDATFRDVYGSGLKWGLEASLAVAPNVLLWAGFDAVHKTGKLTISQEDTNVSITPLSAGARYEFPAGAKLVLHLKAGLQYVFFKEENVIGTASESGLGFLAGGGATLRLTDAIGAGVFATYSTCKLTHNGVNFKAGGLDLGGMIEVRF